MNKGVICLSVEGNIGAGKTTLIEAIEKLKLDNTHICVLREPVHLWEGILDPESGETVLQKFYKDPKKYAFSFQVMAFQTRLQEFRRILNENPECKILLCERSLEADANIFAKMLHDDGLIEPMLYQIYRMMYESALTEFKLDGVVFLNIEPMTCSERIIKRNRNGEEGISHEYLEKCHQYHTNWLVENIENNPYKVIHLNESELDNILFQPEELKKWIDSLMQHWMP